MFNFSLPRYILHLLEHLLEGFYHCTLCLCTTETYILAHAHRSVDNVSAMWPDI